MQAAAMALILRFGPPWCLLPLAPPSIQPQPISFFDSLAQQPLPLLPWRSSLPSSPPRMVREQAASAAMEPPPWRRPHLPRHLLVQQLPVEGALHRAPPAPPAMDPRGCHPPTPSRPLLPPLRPVELEAKRHGVVPARPSIQAAARSLPLLRPPASSSLLAEGLH
ncbi:hypothetical protein BS78_10G034000 [Paspalum vaginatum]|nr:hypothetical protein BS78_10G034000 [Paspalum vaginatum]